MPAANPTAQCTSCVDALSAAVALAVDARAFKHDSGRGLQWIGRQRVELIAGLSCLRMHMAWEVFLEETFVRYLCGAKPDGGPGPVLLQTACPTIAAARALLLGRQQYVSWRRKETRQRAGKYFDSGYNFTPALLAASDAIETLVAARNAVAHRSASTSRAFHDRVRMRFGYAPRGITPGGFLIRSDPANPQRRIIESLAIDLQAAANTIAP